LKKILPIQFSDSPYRAIVPLEEPQHLRQGKKKSEKIGGEVDGRKDEK
jgi:hypothetical protein